MYKPRHLSLIITMAVIIFSCSKESELAEIPVSQEKVQNVEVTKFYDYLSRIIKATSLREVATRVDDVEEEIYTGEYYLEHEEDYPLQAKLAAIHIEDEDGTIVSFFDLPDEEQSDFIDFCMDYEADLLSEKVQQVPELEEYIAEENRVVEEILEENGIPTRSGDFQIHNPQEFLSSLSLRMEEMASSFAVSGTSMTRSTNDRAVAFNKVIDIIAGKANRGDVLVALPSYDNPACIIDFGNKKYKLGHAEILTKDITNTTTQYEYSTVGAWTDDGVSEQTLDNWCWESYLVGICHYKVVWKWRGLKSRFYTEKRPVSNPSALATCAGSYLGSSYVYWYEFLSPKWAAPSRFTCTSLVWWCAKKEYGVVISPWYHTLVTPADVLCDSNTDIKARIH